MARIKYVYGDSSIFISYLNEVPERINVLEALFDEISRDNERKLITSVFTKIEVANLSIEKKVWRQDEEAEGRIDALWNDDSLVEIVEMHNQIALTARDFMRRGIDSGWSLKPADALHLASAQWVSVSEFFSYDNGFDKYSDMTGLTINRPYVQQGELPLDYDA